MLKQPPSIQAITKEGLLSPDRDIAHNFRFVIEEANRRLGDDRWGDLAEIIKHYDVSRDDLAKACEAMVVFVVGAAEPGLTMHELLTQAGFFTIKPAAQIAYMATVGQIVTGVYWQGARLASITGKGPCRGLEDYLAAGRETARLLRLPKWLRPWNRFWTKLRKATNALRS